MKKGEIWSFEAYTIAKEGKDKGLIYGGISWGVNIDKKGKLKSHAIGFLNVATQNFKDAVAKWNSWNPLIPLGPFR